MMVRVVSDGYPLCKLFALSSFDEIDPAVRRLGGWHTKVPRCRVLCASHADRPNPNLAAVSAAVPAMQEATESRTELCAVETQHYRRSPEVMAVVGTEVLGQSIAA